MIFFDAVLDLESKINKIPNVFTDKPLFSGAIAQLGERLPCTQEVSSSILLSSTISFLFYYFYSLASKPIPRLGILTSRSKLKKQCFFRAFFTLLSSTISSLFYYFLSLASKPTGQAAVSVIIYNHPFCLAIRAASLRLEAFNLLIASLR